MSNVANFLIFQVRYNQEHTHIIAVMQVRNQPNSIPTQIGRLEVITNIHAGLKYATAYHDNGTWNYGNEVFVEEVGGTEYIKTEPDDRLADNLGELPEF